MYAPAQWSSHPPDEQKIWVRVPPGANPTIACYNASVVNFYNATDSLACFENKIIFLNFEKRSSLPTTTLAL
jgi:hypothetical protein